MDFEPHTSRVNEQEPTVDRTNSYIFFRAIEKYIVESSNNIVLRPHQLDVFDDLKQFFISGGTRGYINLPTGTGKTVLFVELSKALREADLEEGVKPRILVVTPTKDLVHQTLGRTGEKGYGRFAPELNVGSYFSDSSNIEKKKIDEYDVVVTTYLSFQNMSRVFEFDINKDSGDDVIIDRRERNLLESFDVIILDEAHHALGDAVGNLLSMLPEDKIVLGFTATPDADDIRQLSNHLPHKIHELQLNEAVSMGLLAPIAPLGIKSGIKIHGSGLYDESGDFIDSKISYLARDSNRNSIIVSAASILARDGIGTIISCMAGDEAWHARHLAELLQKNGVRSIAVYAGIGAKERQAIYRDFNNGKIDVLTFIGVLGEGWDSSRAKGLINARPTRSPIFAKQRLGRITRLGGGIGISIDICDEIGDINHPINVADILNQGDIDFGYIAGVTNDFEKTYEILNKIKQNHNVQDVLVSEYQSYQLMLAGLRRITGGVIRDGKGKKEYVAAPLVNPAYSGVTDEIINRAEELYGVEIKKILAGDGNRIRTVYKLNEVERLITSLPNVDLSKYFIDEEGNKWISTEGLATLFSKRYPDVSKNIIDLMINTSTTHIEWIPVRYLATSSKSKHRKYCIEKMYIQNGESIEIINDGLKDYYS